MNLVFTINFRREAFQRQMAHARRRLVLLAGWLAYFGLTAVILGLYGLNCMALGRRVRQVERQMSLLRSAQGTRIAWTVDAARIAEVERYQANPGRWRDRLVRLSWVLPSNAVLYSLVVNPDNLSSAGEQERLSISGQMRVGQGSDRMRSVLALVTALQKDSLFAAGYKNIRLVSSRVSSGSMTDFVIECR